MSGPYDRDWRRRQTLRGGMSLLELAATLGILGLVAAIAIPRVAGFVGAGHAASCQTLAAQVELQALRWKRNRGSWPAADLADIGADPAYFPTGLPTCPVTGAAYALDAHGRVQGHAH